MTAPDPITRVAQTESSDDSSASLTEELRARLCYIADTLIPADGHMPAASEIDIVGGQLDLVLRSRPELEPHLVRALSRRGDDGDPVEWITHLEAEDPEGYDATVLAIVAGYYMSPIVKELLGYPGQTGAEVSANVYPPYISEGLLDELVERGPIYREPPEDLENA